MKDKFEYTCDISEATYIHMMYIFHYKLYLGLLLLYIGIDSYSVYQTNEEIGINWLIVIISSGVVLSIFAGIVGFISWLYYSAHYPKEKVLVFSQEGVSIQENGYVMHWTLLDKVKRHKHYILLRCNFVRSYILDLDTMPEDLKHFLAKRINGKHIFDHTSISQ